MTLFLLRHASAGTRRINPLLDRRRPLDADGKRHCLQLAHLMNALKIQFDQVVSSPLKRCLQTAQLVATETSYETGILHSNALAPEGTVTEFLELVAAMDAFENLLLVGHNPNLQQFAGALLAGGRAGSLPAALPAVRLRKGSIARFSLGTSPGKSAPVLQSILDPRLVRALYSTSTKSSRRKTSRK